MPNATTDSRKEETLEGGGGGSIRVSEVSPAHACAEGRAGRDTKVLLLLPGASTMLSWSTTGPRFSSQTKQRKTPEALGEGCVRVSELSPSHACVEGREGPDTKVLLLLQGGSTILSLLLRSGPVSVPHCMRRLQEDADVIRGTNRDPRICCVWRSWLRRCSSLRNSNLSTHGDGELVGRAEEESHRSKDPAREGCTRTIGRGRQRRRAIGVTKACGGGAPGA